MLKKLFLLVVTSIIMLSASAQIHKWGEVSKLTVVDNHLEDPEGNQVMLHGIMDTPSPYFSGFRWGYNLDRTKCLEYFEKLFTAVTDTAQSSWCNVFRLHLDPCWTNNDAVVAEGFTNLGNGKWKDPNGTEVDGEANIVHYDRGRLNTYIYSVFYQLANKAKSHGMYVIMRPPGVCPSMIKVGDYYQKYLLDVWDIVTKQASVKNNSDWLMIELANEPVAVKDANGNDSNSALHDFFQPIVDKIRANGYKGIIWVPGATWQQEYRPYGKKPITDPMLNEDGTSANQIGYAVHFYPGWFSTSDDRTDHNASINSFLNMVPVVKTSPIMITEVDWSPQDPTAEGHYNESGQWVVGNCGTWGTGSTSGFGLGFKAVADYFGNIGWTLTHTHDYLDIDYYLETQTVRPAFSTKLENNAYEACSGACFQWYKQYAHTEHVAKVWEVVPGSNIQPTDEQQGGAANLNGKTLFLTDPDLESILYVNESLDSPQNVQVGTYDDIADNPYCWLKFNKVSNPGCSTSGNLYTIQLANETGSTYNLWGAGGYLNTPPGTWCLFALGLGSKYGQDANYYGLWKVDYEEGSGYTIQNVGAKEANQNSWLDATQGTPQGSKRYVRLFGKLSTKPNSIDSVSETAETETIVDLYGRKVETPEKGKIYIQRGKKLILK